MTMTDFEDYRNSFATAVLERRDGVLLVRFHTDGEHLTFDSQTHGDWSRLFRVIATDRENKVVVMTGTGDTFSGPIPRYYRDYTPTAWDETFQRGVELHAALLSIGVPVIAAINGPAVVHAEVPLMSDIVIATPNTYFQDLPHLGRQFVPGDGMHIVMPMLMGRIRTGHFLLLGDQLGVEQAQQFGLVNEIVPIEQLVPRALEMAGRIASYSHLNRRYTRMLLVRELRKAMEDSLALGLALEGLGAVDAGPTGGEAFDPDAEVHRRRAE
jgi:enoyl-CoA hydratase/carnithine racemase